MSQRTPLYEAHRAAGGKLVEFAGWELPIHYGSLMDEHHAVRKHAGMFDVSHMTTVDIRGADAKPWLRRLLTNDVAKLDKGQALYSCLCNESGGVLDDLIVTAIADTHYRLVVNAATSDKDIAWFRQQQSGDVTLEVPDDLAMLAVQGPEAVAAADRVLDALLEADVDLSSLGRFHAAFFGDCFVARTGYTGEDGVEITVPAASALPLWDALGAADVRPAGLGARDTLRIEAAMSLYGNELTEEFSPVAAGLGWTIDLVDDTRDFIGREVLEDHKQFGCGWFRVGLELAGRGVLRSGQAVQLVGKDVGVVTSGTFSPTLGKSIALARVDRQFKGSCDVIIRDRPHVANVVSLPFVRHGLTSF